MQGLLDTAEREFRVDGWKSPASPVTDATREEQKKKQQQQRQQNKGHFLAGVSRVTPQHNNDTANASNLGLSKHQGSARYHGNGVEGKSANSRQPTASGEDENARRRCSDNGNLNGGASLESRVLSAGGGASAAGEQRQVASRKRQRANSDAEKSGSRADRPSPPNHPEVETLGNGEHSVAEPTRHSDATRTEDRGDEPARSSVPCEYDGCNKLARSAARRFCRRHGEGRRCKTPGCNKVDVGGGNCRKHGGGRRCGADNCLKTDVGGGFCVSHGGGKRCQAEGCAKGAQAGGVFCKSHGGGRRCRVEGCMTSAQSGTDVLCIKHGGGKRCLVPECRKLVRRNKRCTKHASEQPNEVLATARTAPATAAATAVTPKTPPSRHERRHPPPSPTPPIISSTVESARPPHPPVNHGDPVSAGRTAPDDDPPSNRGGNGRRGPDSVPPAPPFRPRGRLEDVATAAAAAAATASPASCARRPFPRISTTDVSASGFGKYSPEKRSTRRPPNVGGSGGDMLGDTRDRPFLPRSDWTRVPGDGGGGGVGTVVDSIVSGSRMSLDGNGGRRFNRFPLPGFSSIGASPASSTLSASSSRDEPLRSREVRGEMRPLAVYPASDMSAGAGAATPLSSRGGGPGGRTATSPEILSGAAGIDRGGAGALDGGRINIANDLLSLSAHADMAGSAAATVSGTNRRSGFGEGAGERCASLSPPPLALQLPPFAFPSPAAPTAVAAAGSGVVSGGGGGDAAQVLSRGECGGARPSRGGGSPWAAVPTAPLSMDRAAVAPFCSTSGDKIHSRSSSRPIGESRATSGTSHSPVGGSGGGESIARSSLSAAIDANPGTDCRSSRSTAGVGGVVSGAVAPGHSPVGGSGGGESIARSSLSIAIDATPGTDCRSSRSTAGVGGVVGGAVAPGVSSRRTSGDRDKSLCRNDGDGEARIPAGNGLSRCGGAPDSSPSSPALVPTYISLSVEGMMCMANCGQTVQRALSAVGGVRNVTVHFPTRTASVQVEPEADVSLEALSSALDVVGFGSTCIATSTTEEPTLEHGVNAVWAIASALGLVDRGCAMAWGEACNCGDDCKCVNCPQHMKKVSHAVDLVLKAVDLSTSEDPPAATTI